MSISKMVMVFCTIKTVIFMTVIFNRTNSKALEFSITKVVKKEDLKAVLSKVSKKDLGNYWIQMEILVLKGYTLREKNMVMGKKYFKIMIFMLVSIKKVKKMVKEKWNIFKVIQFILWGNLKMIKNMGKELNY